MFSAPPHLDVYYASTCAPCRLELPAVLQALRDGKHIRILIVSDVQQARADLAATSPRLVQVAQVADGRDARDRLRRAGDTDGILPFTRSMDAQEKVCTTWRGALTRLRIRDLLSRCR